MATIHFSVPEDVKAAFNAAFAGRNKSAVIARLMREAVEEEAKKQRRREAMERIMETRKHATPVSEEEFRKAREEVRE